MRGLFSILEFGFWIGRRGAAFWFQIRAGRWRFPVCQSKIQNRKSKILSQSARARSGGQVAELRHGAWFWGKALPPLERRFPREVVKRRPATGSPRTPVVRTSRRRRVTHVCLAGAAG